MAFNKSWKKNWKENKWQFSFNLWFCYSTVDTVSESVHLQIGLRGEMSWWIHVYHCTVCICNTCADDDGSNYKNKCQGIQFYLPTTSTHTHSGNKCTRVCGGWVAVKEIEKILSSQLISLHCPALWLVQSHVSWAAIGGPMQPRCWLVFMRNICWLISWKINGGSSMWGYSETQHRRILHSHVVVVFRDAT